MPNTPAIIEFENNELLVKLPITSPTGRIRVKCRKTHSEFGIPFSTRSENITKECYIEWQIGYDTEDIDNIGVIKEIAYVRNSKVKYGFELTRLFYLAIINNVIQHKIIEELLNFIDLIERESYLDNISRISRNFREKITLNGLSLEEFDDVYNAFLMGNNQYVIEAIIKHKQRAVGYQPMVYLCLPIEHSVETIIGRKANTKEYLTFKITEDNNFIVDCMKIFAITSQQHKEDIKNILEKIKEIRN